MWELDYKDSWVLKNWCFWTLVLEKTLESALDSKEIKPVNPKWNQSWIFNRKTDWCWNSRSNTLATWWEELTWQNWHAKCNDVEKDWRQKDKGTTEDETVAWYYRLNGHECEQALGVGDGQGSLVCYSPWGQKESDTTEQLNWTE